MRTSRPRSLSSRRGVTLVELTIAAIVLSALMITAIPTLTWVGRFRQSAERRQAAVLEVGNLMERLTALSWDEITQESMARIELPEELAQRLPEADLRISVLHLSGPPEVKRVLIELRWRDSSAGAPTAPIRLAAWVYRPDREVS